MSDFLSKFSKDNYKKDKSSEEDKVANVQTDKVINEKEENKKDDIVENKKVETANKVAKNKIPKDKNSFATASVKEEVLVRDDEKIKKRKQKIIIASISAVVLIAVIFFGYRQFNQVNVPEFVNEKTLEEVQVWAAKNKLDLEDVSKFSTKIEEGKIISQSVKGGKTIQKGSYFKVVVSKGADPEEHIKLPEFEKMSLTEIESWKDENKANNVAITKVYSEEIDKGKVIKVDFKTEGISKESYRRKDKIEITVSKGKETFEKDIVVPDFKNKSRSEVETWASEKEVKVEFSEAADSKIMEGMVISQDVPAKTKIAKNDIVKIVVSRGKVAYAPSFYGSDETQGQIIAAEANVSTLPVQYYDNEVGAGLLISQSLPAGTEITDQTIVLVYSLGKPYIANFDEQDLFSMVSAINEMNGKGARLSYDVIEVTNDMPKGQVVTSNYKANFVNVGSRITIYVSRGK